MEGDVAAPDSGAERIDPSIYHNWLNELLSVGTEARDGEGESTSDNDPLAPGLNGENTHPMTADEEARATSTQDLLQKGIPLREAFEIT